MRITVSASLNALLKSAATATTLFAACAPTVNADPDPIPDFTGNATAPLNAAILDAVADYSTAPSATNTYAKVITAINDAISAGVLPNSLITADTVVTPPPYAITTGFAGAVKLAPGVALKFSGYSGTGSVFNFGAADSDHVSLGVFTAEAGASYFFIGNTTTGTSIGPAINNSGTVVMSNAVFSGNRGIQSGAITNEVTGKMILSDAVFSRNGTSSTASPEPTFFMGAAILNKAAADAFSGGDRGVMTLVNATFIGNKTAGNGGGVIDNRGTLNLKTTAGNTTLFAGNSNALSSADPGQTVSNSLYLQYEYGAPVVNIFTASAFVGSSFAPAGVIDMRGGIAVSGKLPGSVPVITKTATDPDFDAGGGAGIWKIGGAVQATIFTVQAGTLHLYGIGEVRNPLYGNLEQMVAAGNVTPGNAVFDLKSGATLSLGGGAHGAVAQTTSITFHGGSTISVDLTGVGAGSGGAALTVNGAARFIFPDGAVQMDVRTFNAATGSYAILYGGGGTLNANFKSGITVRGEAISGTRAATLLPSSLANTGSNAVLSQGALVSAVATWNGGLSGGNWNINAANWSLVSNVTIPDRPNPAYDPDGDTRLKIPDPANQFLHGDAVNFANTGTGTATILLNPTGDRTVLASGLYFSGGASYIFQGNAIEVHSARGTSLATATVATGKLILGANAPDTATLNTAVAYTGTVDLTQTGENIFQDVDLYSGTLRISDPMQIAGFLNWFHFKGAADGSNAPTLRIAAGKTAAFIGVGGAGGAAQRLLLDHTSGVVNTEAGAAFVIDGASTVSDSPGGASGIHGGAINVINGGKLTFTGTGAANFTFSNNVSNGGGGVAYSAGSDSTVTFGSGTAFVKNTATTVGGGAIYVTGGGAVALNNAIFDGNTSAASGSKGGAIYNAGGTVTLNVTSGQKSVFSGNKVNGAANSIHIDAPAGGAALVVTTAGTGTLYSLDPITVTANSNATTITKNGTGTWKLAGTNDLANATVTITAGTVHLYAKDAVEAISIPGAIREVNGVASPYGVNRVLPAGVMTLGATGTLNLVAGTRLIFGGLDSALKVASGGTVTIAPGAELVFRVLEAGAHGVIQANVSNLTVGSAAKLILDLDPVYAASLSEDFAQGGGNEIVIPGLFFTNASGGTLLDAGELGNFTISDTQGRFVWSLTDGGSGGIGGIRLLGENLPPAPPVPAPEPSTYGLLGGLVVLGFAVWRRKKKGK